MPEEAPKARTPRVGMNCFDGLTNVNIELSSRCNKNCWCCGRRKIDREYPEIAMNYGDMDPALAKSIAEQLPDAIVVQFHNNGESILHPRFGEIIRWYRRQIRTMDTNGKLIVARADEIIGELDTLTVSVIPDDPDVDEQYEIVRQFLKIKGESKPRLIYRILGGADSERWEKLPGMMVTRVLHSPLGSFDYERKPTIPEIGICLEMLNHLSIDRLGRVSMCVRFDPNRVGVIGDANTTPLVDIWNGEKRQEWRQYHIEGRRDKVPLCSYCHFWGVPIGS
ncbi:MAG: SPASM domain-containing protein [Chloroflexi bacterium]|nr:SPASM domain-containing protein [Chloroflexota bacterium]